VARQKAPIHVGIDPAQLAEVVGRLRDLDKKAARAAVRKGLNEVTKVVTKDAKANVPKGTGLLRKSIGRKIVVSRGGAKLLGVVKPRGGAKFTKTVNGKKVNPIRYAHLVEYGRVRVFVKNKKVLAANGKFFGASAKAVAPRPFLRPAWDKNKGAAVALVSAQVQRAIATWWQKRRAGAPKAKRAP
jgi:HK97 gp10 family phage protein